MSEVQSISPTPIEERYPEFASSLQWFIEERGKKNLKESFDQVIKDYWDVGRNDPCPMHPDKKYKKCCLMRRSK